LRTERSAYNHIIRPSEFTTFSLDLIHPNFYHLDTCFCPLNTTGELLWYPPAFSRESGDKIRLLWRADTRISVDANDAARFACNSISIGKNIIMPMVSQGLQERLRARGYNVFCIDMSEFLKAGGGPKCCTLSDNKAYKFYTAAVNTSLPLEK